MWASEAAKPDEVFPLRQAVLDVYVRDGCPHCADAKAFLVGFSAIRPWLTVRYHAVDQDPAARDALETVTRAAGAWPPGVPTFVYRGEVLVGFGDAQSSGPVLARLVDADRPDWSGQTSPPAPAPPAAWHEAIQVDSLGLPLFTLAMGLLDGFNPCAMWVLLFLLSLLTHLRDRRRMLLIAGTFVLVSGLIYYAFLAAWFNVFRFVGMSSGIRITLALVALAIGLVHVKDYVAFGRGISLSIPQAAKPTLYRQMRETVQAGSLPLALLGTAVLAVMVNVVELLCTAGLPAVYSAVLVQQDLSPGAHHAYLALYILGYIADDSLMVGLAVLALSSAKLDETRGRRLKLISGMVMLGLGLIMLLRPDWLF